MGIGVEALVKPTMWETKQRQHLTLDQLSGEGAQTDPDQQAENLPGPVFNGN